MDLFNFTNADNSSPLGIAIRKATEPVQDSIDWSQVLDICDSLNGGSLEKSQQACRCLTKRLQDPDAKLVNYTLQLCEAIMKNCGANFAVAVDKALMNELSSIAKFSKGQKNSEDARKIIQQWGKAFDKKFPLLIDEFNSLKSEGLSFPEEETVSAQFEISSTQSPAEIIPGPSNQADFQKLEEDLNCVSEQVKLCRELLPNTSGISSDNTLSEVVGFLEACRDKMTDLIEAGSNGLLGEDLFAKCLLINDGIYRTLEAERNGFRGTIDDEFSATYGVVRGNSVSSAIVDSPVSDALHNFKEPEENNIIIPMSIVESQVSSVSSSTATLPSRNKQYPSTLSASTVSSSPSKISSMASSSSSFSVPPPPPSNSSPNPMPSLLPLPPPRMSSSSSPAVIKPSVVPSATASSSTTNSGSNLLSLDDQDVTSPFASMVPSLVGKSEVSVASNSTLSSSNANDSNLSEFDMFLQSLEPKK